jgi:hypothetical protein
LNVAWLAVSTAVIAACGTTAPCWSAIVPAIDPIVKPCPTALWLANIAAFHAARIDPICFPMLPS